MCDVTHHALRLKSYKVTFHRPYDDHVAGRGSQRVDEGAENRHGHVGGEAAAAVLGVRTLAQPHGRAAARRVGGGHAAAVVKDLGKREKPQCGGKDHPIIIWSTSLYLQTTNNMNLCFVYGDASEPNIFL